MGLHDVREVPALVKIDGVPHHHQPALVVPHLLQKGHQLPVFPHEDVAVGAVPQVEVGDEPGGTIIGQPLHHGIFGPR